MTSRSGRGRWQRVIDARDQAHLALGDVQARADRPPKPGRDPQDIHARKPAPYVPGDTELVLTITEAAKRLLVSRDELEVMIEAGTIQSLATDYARMVPVREVERFRHRAV